MTHSLSYPTNPRIDWPLDSNVIRRGRVSNTFGGVRQNADGSIRMHQGWDFYAREGTNLYAIADGEVVGIRKTGNYGKTIVCSFLLGGRTFYVSYSHLSSIGVFIGGRIAKGMQIGLTGITGNASGMIGADQHLHLEIRTQIWCGLGLNGRVSPIEVFEFCPLHNAISRREKW